METVSEKSVAHVGMTFSHVPDEFKYKVVDVFSGTAMKTLTTVVPGALTYDLYLPAAVNVMVTATKPYELRRLTVEWYVGGVQLGSKSIYYKLANQWDVPLA